MQPTWKYLRRPQKMSLNLSDINCRHTMDIKSLDIFLELSKRLHFAQTAQAMHLTPSALSRQIQRIEDELNIKLFQRDNRSVRLTKAGLEFAGFARQTLSDYHRLQQSLHKLRDSHENLTGELTLFCTVTAAHVYVPRLLTAFRRRYPNADIKLITGDASQALSLVKDGEVDFAFAADIEAIGSGVMFLPVEDIHCSLIAPTAAASFSELLALDDIPWNAIPFVVPEAGPLHKAMQAWFKAMGIQPQVYGRVTGHEAIVSMTSLGCGLSIIPDPVMELSPLKHTVRTIHAPIPAPTLELGIIGLQRELQKPIMSAFWRLCQDLFSVTASV